MEDRKIEKEYLKESISQDIWNIIVLHPDLRCTCDEAGKETEIHQARGHYHHCMLWQVARAVDVCFRILQDRDSFVFDESGKSGRFVGLNSQQTKAKP